MAVLEHALNNNLVAILLDTGNVGNLRNVQLLSDLRANLSGITVDSLTAAEYYGISVNAALAAAEMLSTDGIRAEAVSTASGSWLWSFSGKPQGSSSALCPVENRVYFGIAGEKALYSARV